MQYSVPVMVVPGWPARCVLRPSLSSSRTPEMPACCAPFESTPSIPPGTVQTITLTSQQRKHHHKLRNIKKSQRVVAPSHFGQLSRDGTMRYSHPPPEWRRSSAEAIGRLLDKHLGP